LEILLPVVAGDLLLGFLGKVRMIPQALEVLEKLTVSVRNIGSIEKVFVADISFFAVFQIKIPNRRG
jgi:hypothetical protein